MQLLSEKYVYMQLLKYEKLCQSYTNYVEKHVYQNLFYVIIMAIITVKLILITQYTNKFL